MGRLTVEQLAAISAKKKKAREFQEQFPPGSGKQREWTGVNDVMEQKIRQHGRRGRGRLSALYKPVTPSIRTPSIPSFSWDEAAKVAVNDITADSTGMPVILDTNVVVEGLFSHRTGSSPSRRLMELALADSGEIIPCVTNAIVYEYRRVLEMFGDDSLEQLYRLLFRSIVIPVLPDIEILPVESDHSDTPFVKALVLTMRGSVGNQRSPSRLATYDHHLLNMAIAADSAELLHGRIVTPVQILRELHR